MPTLTGIIFFILGVSCLLLKRDWLPGFLIISTMFGAASVINFGTAGIPPYYFAAGLFVLSEAPRKRFYINKTRFGVKPFLLIFCSLGIVSAIAFPFIFSGTQVCPGNITDVCWIQPVPLAFHFTNVTQAVYLIINIAVVLAAASVNKTPKIEAFYNAAFGILAGVIFLQFLCLNIGINFPYSLLQSNPGYAKLLPTGTELADRMIGTFPEPSVAGLALVPFYTGFFYKWFVSGTSSGLRVTIAVILIGLVRSSGSIISMLVITVLIIGFQLISKPRWIMRWSHFTRLLWMIAAAGLLTILNVNSLLQQYTTDKVETFSYIQRSTLNLAAIRIAADTSWIGAGLGSDRPMSLLAMLLSNMGIAGLVTFLLMLIAIARNVGNSNAWIRWSICALVIDMSLSVPDITEPIMWMTLMFAVYLGTDPRRNARKDRNPYENTSKDMIGRQDVRQS